jgi:hypothetical protein
VETGPLYQETATAFNFTRKTAAYTWADCKLNTDIAKERNITPNLNSIQEYRRNWLQYRNRMPSDRITRIIRIYRLKGRRNQGRPLKKLLGV